MFYPPSHLKCLTYVFILTLSQIYNLVDCFHFFLTLKHHFQLPRSINDDIIFFDVDLEQKN